MNMTLKKKSKAQMARDMIAENKSTTEIAAQLNCSRAYIYQIKNRVNKTPQKKTENTDKIAQTIEVINLLCNSSLKSTAKLDAIKSLIK